MDAVDLSEGIPAGWGYRPGTVLMEPTAESLPELPLLRFLGPQKRAQAIVDALRPLPNLYMIKASHVQVRYDLNHQTARDVLRRAKGS